MPRLLQIDSCFGVLSTGRISEGIAIEAMRNGWDCYMAHGARYVGESRQSSFQIGNKREEYLHYIKSLLFDAHGLGSKSPTTQLIKFIENIKPDVIQLHCIHGYYLNYQILFEYLSKAGIPVVWTQHDCWAFTGHCYYFGLAECNKWKNQCYDCPLKRAYPRSLIDNSRRNFDFKKRLFTSVDKMTVVSVSKWLDSVVNDSFLNIYPHQVIYNGIDTSVFKPYDESIKDKYGIKTPHFLLAVSSGWSDGKGLRDYKALSRIIPSDYSIVLVGVDESTKKELPDEIIAIPRTDSKHELAYLYSDADFVMSLSYCETMGLTAVEGMACGTPAIVYDNTAQPEIVNPDVGYVIKTGEYKSIIKVLETNKALSVEEKELRKRKCIERAGTLFDSRARYNDYIDLYNEMMGIY